MFQGFYFSKPEMFAENIFSLLSDKINKVSGDVEKHVMEILKKKNVKNDIYSELLQFVISEFSSVHFSNFESKLSEIAKINKTIECMYVLNRFGVQITDTVKGHFPADSFSSKSIFSPDAQGADQSLKEYFLQLKSGLKKFISEPYISLATGNICITVSAQFFGSDGEKYILCVDMKE
jgi:hypothetical protein